MPTGCLNPVSWPRVVSSRKVEYFADTGARHTAPELRQLNPARRMTILYCYLTVSCAHNTEILVNVLTSFLLNEIENLYTNIQTHIEYFEED